MEGASTLAAFARTAEQLSAVRALLGVAAARIALSTLSLISNQFAATHEVPCCVLDPDAARAFGPIFSVLR